MNRVLACLVVMLTVAACTVSSSTPGAPTPGAGGDTEQYEGTNEPMGKTHKVTLSNFRFTPGRLTIHVGDTVEWVWDEGMHSVVSGVDCKPDGVLDSGSHPTPFTFRHTFAEPGTMQYYCDVREHCLRGQIGTIQVEP